LKVERVFAGDLQIPTSMAFLDPNDILVLEKNKGVVDRIVNGKLLPQPLYKSPILLIRKLNGACLELRLIRQEQIVQVLHTFFYIILRRDLIVENEPETTYIDMNSLLMGADL